METYINIRITSEGGSLAQLNEFFSAIARRDPEAVTAMATAAGLDAAQLGPHLDDDDFWSIEDNAIDEDGDLHASWVCGSQGLRQLHLLLVFAHAFGATGALAHFTHDEDPDEDGDIYGMLNHGEAKLYRAQVNEEGEVTDGEVLRELDVHSLEPLEPAFDRETIDAAVRMIADDGMRAAGVAGAAIKGVLAALAITLVTVLLFEGLWLWLALGAVLLVVLPLHNISNIRAVTAPLDEARQELDALMPGVPEHYKDTFQKAMAEAALATRRKGDD